MDCYQNGPDYVSPSVKAIRSRSTNDLAKVLAGISHRNDEPVQKSTIEKVTTTSSKLSIRSESVSNIVQSNSQIDFSQNMDSGELFSLVSKETGLFNFEVLF